MLPENGQIIGTENDCRRRGTIWLPLMHDECDRCRVAAASVLCTVMGDDRKLNILLDKNTREASPERAAHVDGSVQNIQRSSSATLGSEQGRVVSVDEVHQAILRTYCLLPLAIAAESEPRMLVQLLRAANAAVTGHSLALISTSNLPSKSNTHPSSISTGVVTYWPLGDVVLLSQRLLLVREEHAGLRAAAVSFLSAILGGGGVGTGHSAGEPIVAVAQLLQAQETAHEQQQQAHQDQQQPSVHAHTPLLQPARLASRAHSLPLVSRLIIVI